SLQIAIELLQLAFEFLEQGERICSRSREAGDHTVVMELAHLARATFHDSLAQTDLTIPHDHHFPAAANRQYGCTVHHNHSLVEDRGSRIENRDLLPSIFHPRLSRLMPVDAPCHRLPSAGPNSSACSV